MSEIKDIPKHWEIKKLGEVCEITSSRRIFQEEYVSNGIPFYRTKEVKELSENKELSVELFISNEKYNEIKSKNDVPKIGDILISAVGTIGISYIIKDEKAFYFKDGNLIWLKNLNYIKSKYLNFYLMHFIRYKQEIITSGSAYNALTIVKLKAFELPLPPLSEQQAIVAKIEELLSELDNGKQQLLTAQQQLKVYRQSLLKWAFEGRLTNKNVKDGELPKGWKWVELKDLTSVLGDGLHGTPKYSETGDYYFINGNNLNDGKIEIKENTKRVSIEEFNKYKKPLNENTIFVSINGSLGYTAFYNNEKVVLGKSACYFNVLDTVNKYYIRYFLTSSSFSSYALKNATGSTIKNVGLKTMRELQIPIPPTLKEQQQIVEELESKLTVCDKIEETISQSLQQAEALRQSILKKAFEGRLV